MIVGIVGQLKQQIKDLETKIKSIQDQCSHPKEALESKNGGNTGNYDPSNDCYWIDHHCHLCEKKWTDYMDRHGRPVK